MWARSRNVPFGPGAGLPLWRDATRLFVISSKTFVMLFAHVDDHRPKWLGTWPKSKLLRAIGNHAQQRCHDCSIHEDREDRDLAES